MELSSWDETSCSLLCQHPCCWSSVNRIERRVPRKVSSIVKVDALDCQSSRDEEDNKKATTDHVFDGGVIITSPTICNLLKSFPNYSEPFSPLDGDSEQGQHKSGLSTDIDSQESLRLDVPKCPPGSEDKVPVLSSKEKQSRSVHVIRAFIMNGSSDSAWQPPYIWVPSKKKETKQSVLSGRERLSTQIFEASQVLECDKKQRTNTVLNKSEDWAAWMSSSRFRFKSSKCRYKPITGFERQKTVSSDFEFCFNNFDQQASKHLLNKKSAKGDLLQTRGLSADSTFFWKPTSVIKSPANKKCPLNLEPSQIFSLNSVLSNRIDNSQKKSKNELGMKNNDSVEIPSFEISHGKLTTISLELGSEHNCPPSQQMNCDKRSVDILMEPVSTSTNNLRMRIKDHRNNASDKEMKRIIKDESGINRDQKKEDTTIANDHRKEKKELSGRRSKFISYQATPTVSSIETTDGFGPQQSCFVEAMPLHRVRIPSPTAKLTRGQPCSRGRKAHGHVSGKRRSVMLPTTSHPQEEGLSFSKPIECSETINKQKATGKDDSTDKLDFSHLPKPPPPSPQILSNLHRGQSSHQLYNLGQSESMGLQKTKNENELLPKK